MLITLPAGRGSTNIVKKWCILTQLMDSTNGSLYIICMSILKLTTMYLTVQGALIYIG